MVADRNTLFITSCLLIVAFHFAQSANIKDIFTSQNTPEISENDSETLVRVLREALNPEHKSEKSENLRVEDSEKIVRKARDSKYYSEKYGAGSKDLERVLKPEDDLEDRREVKGGTALGKRCTTCDSGYLGGSTYTRGRDRYDTQYDRDPYSSGRERYDRYDRDRYDRYDDYDREGGYRDNRGRNRYSSFDRYDRYDPRDRYSYNDRGIGYDNRGYNYRGYRDDYYSPEYRDRYDPYGGEDYYSRGGYGLDTTSRGRGSDSSYYSGRPDYYGYGSYARGYNYGDRDRYGADGGYGNGYGTSNRGGGYESGGYGSGYGGGGGIGYGSGYGSAYGGSSRSRYPQNDYDTGYRSTSYLYGRPSSTTTDMPKKSEGDSNTASPSQSSSVVRNN